MSDNENIFPEPGYTKASIEVCEDLIGKVIMKLKGIWSEDMIEERREQWRVKLGYSAKDLSNVLRRGDGSTII